MRFHAVLLLTVTMVRFSTQSSFQSSMIEWNFWSKHELMDDHIDMGELLLMQAPIVSPALEAAKRIIDNLSLSPTCAHKPTARLIRQCKLIKPYHQDSSSAEQIDNSRYVYALSMSACEIRKAGEELPERCRLFADLLDVPMSDREIGVVPTDTINSCLESIKSLHYFWTTYDNFRQQSASLCDSSRIDHDREDLLSHYRQSLDVHSELLEALKSQRVEIESAMNAFHENAAALLRDQEKLASNSREQTVMQEQHVDAITERLNGLSAELSSLQQRHKVSVMNDVDQLSHELQTLQSKVVSFEYDIKGFMLAATEAMTGATHDLYGQLKHVSDYATSLDSTFNALSSDDRLEQIQQQLIVSQQAVAESSNLHTMHLATQHAQLRLAEVALEALQRTGHKIEELSKAADLIPASWIDTVTAIQRQYSVWKTELKWLFIFLPITILFWLFRFSLTASVVFLLYVLSRTLTHVLSGLGSSASAFIASRLTFTSLSVKMDDVLFAGLCCLVAATIIGLTAISILACRAKYESLKADQIAKAQTRFLAELERGQRAPVKQRMKRHVYPGDRSARAHTAPPTLF